MLAAKIRFGGDQQLRDTNQGHPAGLRPARTVGARRTRKWSRGRKADGLPVAVSDRLDRSKADQLAAIASGLASLTQGAARCMEDGLVKQTVVEMDRGLLVVMAINDGSCVTVLAASSCDVAMVAYEMTLLVSRSGDVLTPRSRTAVVSVWAAGPGRRDRPAR